ncbi:MAG: glutamate-1-semialdehyde 2,1-aminomutase [Nitrosopumilus sp.]|nr:glutamate-1-semialdehyde 2,1-aminomutase [Nitrosopumilus sp.]MDH3489805.1 glutamate-1-semialdehyde 2,1-aminomutase [Nitrosopumilus sp.]MDH3516628.1 glutamate-1-semialdehyde 2,1-aminomutase [Nitrosopumilus sp.]MDH3564636.1 glutamate-1-semialdehyde 2,1-aminomutase [Nitrosopumilus sp.]MDH5416847.1 glutamate-1-semialdehyde 2,1-aminomutase [Nitrosopumilus sp.]
MLSNSKKLFNIAKKIIPSGVNSPVRYFEPYPFFTKKANGAHIWDVDNNRYIDFCNGYGALLLGHRRKEIINAVSNQLSKGTLYCTPTEAEIELSELIIKNFPSIDKVRLMNTGGEATMTAIRLARGFTKKKKIIKFEGCYHGAHDSVLVKAGSGSVHNGISISDGGLDEVSKNTLVVQYNNIEDLEKTIQKNKDIAGVIVEPILANMGLILPEKNFLYDLRKITEQNNIPLIFDEVVTGFRVAPGGAQEHFGIKPDITTIAKALSNGFTISAVGGRKEIMDLLSPNGKVYQASTFAGNPISVSAAISSIKTINKLKNKLYSKLEKFNFLFSNALDDMATDMNIPHQINFTSSMLQIFFTAKPVVDYTTSKNADSKKFKKMFYTLLKNGIFIAPSQFEVVFLSDAHTKNDLNKTLDAYYVALKSVKH